jgi:drug/metabolite transporter (DMT)-like permease
MGLRELQEQMKRDRKNERISTLISVVVIIFLVLTFFAAFASTFWSSIWMLFFTFCMSILFGFGTILPRRIKDSMVKEFFIRLGFLFFALGGLSLIFLAGNYKLFLDIPDYIHKNYNVIVGPAYIKTYKSTHHTSQTITIYGIQFDDQQALLDEDKYNGKVLRLYYLPHSKYVIDIY